MAKKTSRARQQRALLAAQTLRILERGRYTNADGRVVDINDAIDRAVRGTQLVAPDTTPRRIAPVTTATTITLKNETTLQAGRRLVEQENRDVVILNFASAKNPGGGFLNGSQAQEESLARSSGLYVCLYGSPMYALNRRRKDPTYSHHMIYSPGVPVFRDDVGRLLPQDWRSAFITSPAVNAGVARKRGVSTRRINSLMKERAHRLLRLGAQHGHRTVVLGAWGCGVFRNDPSMVANMFLDLLQGELAGLYESAHFAVYDTRNGRFISAFRAALGDAADQGA
ncbi:MAG: TIGR02452 family protein [Myxococcota bacterium]